VKIGIAIVAALALAVVAFLGLRSVLDDGGADEAAQDAAQLIEGDGATLDDRLSEAGLELEGEEVFEGGEWSIDTTEPPPAEPEDDASSDTVSATGTATLRLPESVGEAGRDLLLYGADTEHELPVRFDVRLVEGDDGWEAESVIVDDPYARPPVPDGSELGGLAGTARKAADSALSLLGPGFYVQPDVYATSTEASKEEWLDARAGNDASYPPYLVDVPQSDLITGPVDRALVVAMGCEYNTADATLGDLEAALGAIDATAAGHLQVAEFVGTASLRPTALSCRRGSPPDLPIRVRVGAQLARSRLTADSEWKVVRLALEFPGADARDVYSVAPETTGDERDAAEFVGNLAEGVPGGEAG
jgi:hypothetical protein